MRTEDAGDVCSSNGEDILICQVRVSIPISHCAVFWMPPGAEPSLVASI